MCPHARTHWAQCCPQSLIFIRRCRDCIKELERVG